METHEMTVSISLSDCLSKDLNLTEKGALITYTAISYTLGMRPDIQHLLVFAEAEVWDSLFFKIKKMGKSVEWLTEMAVKRRIRDFFFNDLDPLDEFSSKMTIDPISSDRPVRGRCLSRLNPRNND